MEEKITSKEEYKIIYERTKELREENKELLDTLTDYYTEIEYKKNNRKENVTEKARETLIIKTQIKDIQTCITANTEEIIQLELKLIEYENLRKAK